MTERPTKQFTSNQRAVAPLVGAIFLFGFLVIGMSVYQAQIVPQENKEVEFQHSQTVQNDLIELRDFIHASGDTEVSRGMSVTLGTNYDARMIAINPPSPTGTISTVDPGQNISVIPDSDSTTTAENLTTKFIQYKPQYSEYQNAPTTTNEHTLLYNSFSEADTQLLVSGQRIFESDKLVIPVLEGDILETRTNAVSVRLTALEREEQSISDNVTVTLPTDAPQLWVDEIMTQSQVRLVEQTDTSVTFEANVSTLSLYRIEVDEVPQDDPTNSLAERFGEVIPDGPIFCTVCDGTDDEETEHNNVNDEDGFENETLIVPEGTDFVPEDSDGDDQSDSVNYTFKSFQIDGNVSSDESVTMTSTDGDIVIGETGSTISGKQFDFDANGDIIIDGATLSTTAGQSGPGNERMTLTATGNISAVNTTLDAAQEIELTAEGMFVDLTDATVIVREGNSVDDNGPANLEVTADNIVVDNTTFENGDGDELKREMNGDIVSERP